MILDSGQTVGLMLHSWRLQMSYDPRWTLPDGRRASLKGLKLSLSRFEPSADT
jgi:hypothetical protein